MKQCQEIRNDEYLNVEFNVSNSSGLYLINSWYGVNLDALVLVDLLGLTPERVFFCNNQLYNGKNIDENQGLGKRSSSLFVYLESPIVWSLDISIEIEEFKNEGKLSLKIIPS